MKKIMLFCVIACFQASLLFGSWSLDNRKLFLVVTNPDVIVDQGLSSSTGDMVVLNHKGNPVFLSGRKIMSQEGRIFVMDFDGKLESIARKHYGDRYNDIKQALQKLSQDAYNKWVKLYA